MQEKYSIDLEVNKVKIEFSKKAMTSYGGFSLLAAFFNKIKLREQIEAIIPIKEESPNSLGIYEKMLGFILTVFCGGNRFDHLPYLGSTGGILEKIFGLKGHLPKASTTLTRMFHKIKSFKLMEEVSTGVWQSMDQLIPWIKISSDWLGFDSSVLERYGEQEGAKLGYNPRKKGRPSHHPLLGFLSNSRFVVNIWNRRGDVGSSNNAINFFRQTYDRINKRINILGVRMDSGFYREDLIKEIESKELIYLIVAVLYRPLQLELYSQKHWVKQGEGIELCEFIFKHAGWDKARRYVGIRQHIKKRKKARGKQLSFFESPEYRYSAIITNSDNPMEDIYRNYNPRGNDENVVKELKYDFALGGFSTKKFYATEAAMVIRVLAYNLYNLFRYEILAQKTRRMEQLITFRNKHLIIPGILGGNGRDEVLRLSVKNKKFRQKYIYIFSCINQWLAPV